MSHAPVIAGVLRVSGPRGVSRTHFLHSLGSVALIGRQTHLLIWRDAREPRLSRDMTTDVTTSTLSSPESSTPYSHHQSTPMMEPKADETKLVQPQPVERPSHRRPRNQRRGTRFIQTLNPATLSSSDFIDVSGSRTPRIFFHDTHAGLDRSFRIFYGISQHICTPFPENTKGFLYYHRQLSQLRFRLTGTTDPTHSFDGGKDLLLPNGQLWHTFPNRSENAKGNPLPTLMQQEGLFSKTLDDNGQPIPSHTFVKRVSALSVSGFGAPFMLDLSKRAIYIRYSNLSDGTLGRDPLSSFYNPLSCEDRFRRNVSFFKGKISCCFERSTLPHHLATKTVVIRILGILEPIQRLRVDLDNMELGPRAQEILNLRVEDLEVGKLLPRKVGRPWSYTLPTRTSIKNGLAKLVRNCFMNDDIDQ